MNNFLDLNNEEETKEETKEENRLNMPPPPPPENKTNSIDALVEAIEKKQKSGIQEYHFRPVYIDGVYCYIVLYLKHNMLTVESINIKCNFQYNDQERMLPYVLYHHHYSSIKKAVLHVQRIHNSYRLINGDLVSSTNYNDMKLEECIIPYSVHEVCCVCLDNTTDTTCCGHYICFACRDKCCIQKKTNCPICRKPNVLPVYHNVMNLINNTDYSELLILFKNKLPPPYRLEPETESDEEEEEDEESDEEYDEEQEEINLYVREVDSIS